MSFSYSTKCYFCFFKAPVDDMTVLALDELDVMETTGGLPDEAAATGLEDEEGA